MLAKPTVLSPWDLREKGLVLIGNTTWKRRKKCYMPRPWRGLHPPFIPHRSHRPVVVVRNSQPISLFAMARAREIDFAAWGRRLDENSSTEFIFFLLRAAETRSRLLPDHPCCGRCKGRCLAWDKREFMVQLERRNGGSGGIFTWVNRFYTHASRRMRSATTCYEAEARLRIAIDLMLRR